MLEFLPEQNKKAVKREYKTRVFVTALFLSLTCFVASVCLLVPSYLLSGAKENTALLNLKNATNSETSLTVAASRQEFESFQKDLLLLKPNQSAALPSEVLAPVLADKPAGIVLTNFTYSSGILPTLGTIQIVGVASARNVLVNYVTTLQAEKLFASVDFPISNLATEKNIDFSIQVTGKF